MNVGLICTLIAGLSILVGGIIIFLNKNNDKLTNFCLSIAFGVITSLIILELIPESVENLLKTYNLPLSLFMTLFFSLIGAGLLKALDCFIPHHDHDHDHKHIKENMYHIGIMSSIAIIIHNFFEGMVIYTSVSTSLKMGILITIGVSLHNIPLGILVATFLDKANQSKKMNIIIFIALVLSTLLGGVFMVLFTETIINEVLFAILLCITLGMLSYITICELLPAVKESHDKKNTFIGIIIGVGIMLLSIFLG